MCEGAADTSSGARRKKDTNEDAKGAILTKKKIIM
jgi:hypothetical protein